MARAEGLELPAFRSVDTCQVFSVVRIGPQADMIAAACPYPFASRGKSFARVAPNMAPSRTALRSTTLGRARLGARARHAAPTAKDAHHQ